MFLVVPIFVLLVAFYYLFSEKVVRSAVKQAKKAGRNHILVGWVTGLIMYSLVLWDFIPTHAMHHYYCATQAGFTVYKTLDQWKLENPGVSETLTPIEKGRWEETENQTRVYQNERFAWEFESIMHPLKIHERNERLVDLQTGEILARYVDFDTSVGNPIVGSGSASIRDFKWWIKVDSCEPASKQNARIEFYKFKYLLKYQKEYEG